MPNLNDLLRSASLPPAEADQPILGLTADSRMVKPGFLFAALPGLNADGRAFIAAALNNGATAILTPHGTHLPERVHAQLVYDDNPRHAFALMAAAFYGRQPETTVAVTGTSGKTSTVQFTRQIWQKLGYPAASLGTMGIIGPAIERYNSRMLTTPDPVTLHSALAELAADGISHLAMEASSQGLDQCRLDGVHLKAAGFTNLSRDHLDYHGSMEVYFAAKAMLFERVLPPGAGAVINADTPEFPVLQEIAARRGLSLLAFGRAGHEICVHAIEALPDGQVLDLEVLGKRRRVRLPLVAPFQAWNALCALGLVLASGEKGVDTQNAVAALEHLAPVRGRLELVGTHPSGAPIFVDYAHKPEALEIILTALRHHTQRHLSIVFGCGGDRDRGKRPQMGGIAARLADHIIVTDDNPRSEEADSIRAAIMDACSGGVEIGDRAAAITTAIKALGAGDVLVIAGKGHEQGQIIGAEVRPFDDAAVARAALAALMETVPE